MFKGQQQLGVQVALADTNLATMFSLNQIDVYASLISIFDQYKIEMVECKFQPNFTENPVSTSNYTLPRLYTVFDYDDANLITIAQAGDYDSCVVTDPGKSVIRTVRPRAALAMYNTGAVFSGYGSTGPRQWVDCASPAVPYYGVKWCIQQGGTSQTALQVITLTTTYYMSFRYKH